MDTVKNDEPMPDGNKCPQCGTPLPTGALAGLCPACLLKMGAAADTVTDAKQPPFTPPPVTELAPLFPQLEILELIGKGGMGAVYKARQKQLDRIVALKILPPGIGDDPAFAGRFAREAKALAKLNHPGIVTLYEFGLAQRSASGTPAPLYFFLMEYVDGVNLRQLLRAGRISPREALAIVPQICDALQFAHDQGIVHRDIKPENILLDRRGRVKVADFGLAKIVEPDSDRADLPVSEDGEAAQRHGPTGVMGTPNYMSPEQVAAPGEVDHRADIYALGVVFYQMLTGELPGKQLEAPSKKVLIDVRLDEIVLRALEKNPELRYQQVSEVKTRVETIAATPTAADAPATPAGGTPKNKSGLVRLVELLFNITFASSTAILLINLSALGFLAFLAFLGNLPLPGMQRFYGFSGFAGLFGLIGVAFLIEMVDRRKTAAGKPTPAANLQFPVNCPVTMEKWLALMDTGEYGKSWETAAPYFQGKVSKEEWTGKLEKIRRPLGEIMSRKLIAIENTVFGTRYEAKYTSSFDGLPAAVETVTYAKQASGEWQPIGYLIRPAENKSKQRLKKFFCVQLPVALVVLVVIRIFFLQAFRAATDSAAPEIPRGSQFLVWKLAHHFTPGDLIAYRGDGWAMVGRVTRNDDGVIYVNRNGKADVVVPPQDILGKVISVYWRASNGAEPTPDFSIGQTNFPFGDSIEITSVERSESKMTVKGHYKLVSHDNALLALYITTMNAIGVPTDATQQMRISKGQGDFELIESHLVPGWPHVSMYRTNGEPFGSLYFGTKAEAVEESAANWISKTSQPFEADAQLVWTNWNNGQNLGSFYAVAGTETETVAVGIDGRIATRNRHTGVWTIQTFTGDPDFRAIVYAHGQYVVVREKGSIMTSPDGLTWTQRISPTTENLLGLFWDGHQYLAGGDQGIILASPDGIHWTNRDSSSKANFYSFSFSGSRYVVVGNDGFRTSVDSITWTAPNSRWATAEVPFTASTWTGKEFLACGLGLDQFPTIYTCPDGESWRPRDVTVTNSLRAAITINGEIYVAGDNVIKKSTDGGATWRDTFINSTGQNNLFMGLTFDGQNLIAVGFNHNVWATHVSTTKIDDQILAKQPPVVVETFPVSGTRDVEPGETEIRVRFSKEMADGSWSWSTAWENSAPDFIGQPHYEADGRTCAVKVKLEPGRTYAFWLNSEQFRNFQDRAGQSAVPYLLIFQTQCAPEAQSNDSGNTNTNRPVVVFVSPFDGATNVALTQDLRIRFNQPMNPDDVEIQWQDGGFLSDGQFHYEPEQNEFVIPVRLLPGRTNDLSLNFLGGFKNAAGVKAEQFHWRFTTGPLAVRTNAVRPKVVEVSPASQATASVLTFLEVTFDQPMMPPDLIVPHLKNTGVFDRIPAAIHCFEYDPLSQRFLIPLMLPADNPVKLTLDGFYGADGAASDPVVFRCDVGTNDYSAEQSKQLATAAKDPRLERLLSAMKDARRQLNSGVELVGRKFLGVDEAFESLDASQAVFKWQGTNQVYGDITDEMPTKAFILGCDGSKCWLYAENEKTERRLDGSAVNVMADIDTSIADPFGLTTRTVQSVLAEKRLVYAGQAQLAGRMCHRVRCWIVKQSHGKYDRTFVARSEWWIDDETKMPRQRIEYSPYGCEIFTYKYEKFNQLMPDADFQPPRVAGINAQADQFKLFKHETPEPGEKRFLIIRDGADGRMSGRLGYQNGDGSTSSGLN